MVLAASLEARMRDQEVPVMATIGFLYKIRNDRGFYEAKVALLVNPTWYRESTPYLLGMDNEYQEDKRSQDDGAWIQFADSTETIVSQWQPRIGDRVLVLTFGKFGFSNGRIFRLSTSYDTDAKAAEEMKINGPLRVLSGGML